MRRTKFRKRLVTLVGALMLLGGTLAYALPTFETERVYYSGPDKELESLRFNNASINANSRVFVSASEYGTDAATTRFIGSAPIQVLNVAPFNGGFLVWVVIGWPTPINIRFDVLVDP